ncbi:MULTISPECIES: Fe-S cluster assembly protein SufD [Pseudomonas]|uniref:Fe-S cluster assembly protein SufD n=1 Tax=Pseudomonas abyssi TaxID=170540 RepID=A0A395RB29_9PSED|nr:Fe-S cluster assembly protein SufD [Halopseudomonas gallaeciensis]MAG66778.1 Fe-S cluster assembly protein SufD [Pseudomonadales bacterium]RGP57243.1 Fe-S cluster assembly protein SufD [Halopseudomonas gallaeciensis]|tara:strand:- start:317 stop:1624 length:1308 start_codon:yes stop_codon:yes gene_type:complete
MSDFQQTALQLAEQQQSPEWLNSLREQGASTWAKASWPTRKTENWKYLSLAPLQQYQQLGWGAAADSHALDEVEQLQLDATRLVFINGRFSSEHSSALPAGVVRFGEADDEQRTLISQHLGRVVDSERHLFAALSNAWAADGVLVHVPRGQRLEKPIYVVNISTPQRTPVAASQRLLVVLEDNAEAELIEHYASDVHAQNGFVNSLTEVVVGNNAQVQHYRINLEQEDLLHVGGVHVNLQRDARFHGFTLAQGSRLKRIDYQVNMLGEGAHLDLNGIYLPRNRQVIDYHTNVEHCVPHCTSNEVFRGIIGDSAKAVFNGRIHIHPQAQKTLAELSNKNLLTSRTAEINTKPELEIYADDVRCAHGATISQLDETSMYYLQSRGVSKADAITMLSFGFINELLNQVPEQAVQDYLRPRLVSLFGQASETVGQIGYE